MSAQPQFDFSPPEPRKNVDLGGLEDFLLEERPPIIESTGASEEPSENFQVSRLFDQLIQSHQFLEVVMKRLAFVQDRLDTMKGVIGVQSSQMAVIPYYQKKIVALERQLTESEAARQRLENHWLVRWFLWIP